MTREEFIALGKDPPIFLADGRFGLAIQLGKTDIGIQVPGEEDIRWLPLASIVDEGSGALREQLPPPR